MLKCKRLTNDLKRVIMKVQFKGGNVMKKLFKFLVIVFMFVILLGTIEVNAAKITIVKDENPDRVNVLLDGENDYYIEIDENGNVGYLYNLVRGNSELVGTCDIVIYDITDHTYYTLCSSSYNSIGSLVITNNQDSLIISEATGDISNVFYVGAQVIIND